MTRLEQIMSQSDHTDDDIVELASIRRRLAQEAKQLDILANQTEEEYNLARGSEYVKIKERYKAKKLRITDSEAERRAKSESESKFGKYRSLKAEARGMYASLDALSQYIITLQSKKKNERDASGYNIDEETRKGIHFYQ